MGFMKSIFGNSNNKIEKQANSTSLFEYSITMDWKSDGIYTHVEIMNTADIILNIDYVHFWAYLASRLYFNCSFPAFILNLTCESQKILSEPLDVNAVSFTSHNNMKIIFSNEKLNKIEMLGNFSHKIDSLYIFHSDFKGNYNDPMYNGPVLISLYKYIMEKINTSKKDMFILNEVLRLYIKEYQHIYEVYKYSQFSDAESMINIPIKLVNQAINKANNINF